MSRMKDKFPKDSCACLRVKAQKQAFFFPTKEEPFGSLFLPVAGPRNVQDDDFTVGKNIAWIDHVPLTPMGGEQEGIYA